MAYAKNYYHVLGLEAPVLHSPIFVSAAQIRAKYREALFAAHPDKSSTKTASTTRPNKTKYTVDDVKEAFAVLSDAKKKEEFDAWLRQNYDEGVLRFGDEQFGIEDAFTSRQKMDSMNTHSGVGVEWLDLGDFEVVEHGTSEAASPASAGSTSTEVGQDSDGGMEWIRACRCGAEKAYRITEEDLESASREGAQFIRVGCEGCSLSVVVGFDVEEDG